MKLDQDYLKRLLLACQASNKPTFDIEDLKRAGFDYNEPAFEFHMGLLDDQRLVQREDGRSGFGMVKSLDGFPAWSVLPPRLTSDGHTFIEAFENRRSRGGSRPTSRTRACRRSRRSPPSSWRSFWRTSSSPTSAERVEVTGVIILHVFEDEPARQKRAIYLHEAGHVVVGRENGFTTNTVHCDGKNNNYCDQSPPADYAEKEKRLKFVQQDKLIPADDILAMTLAVHEGKIVTLLGGWAGENLELGRPLTSIARGADDLAQILMMIAIAVGRYPFPLRQAKLTAVFTSLAEKANNIAKRHLREIEALADALEKKTPLSKDEVEEVLQKAAATKA